MNNLLYPSQTITDDDVMDFIMDFQRAFPGVSPSFREIAKAMEIKSTGTIQKHIQRLIDNGSVESYREYAGFRGLIVPDVVLFTKEDILKSPDPLKAKELFSHLEKKSLLSKAKIQGRLSGK